MIKTLSKSISGYEIKLIAKRGLLIEKFDLMQHSLKEKAERWEKAFKDLESEKASKDKKNAQVKVYLTETIEGKPGQKIIPFSEVILNPSDVNFLTIADPTIPLCPATYILADLFINRFFKKLLYILHVGLFNVLYFFSNCCPFIWMVFVGKRP